MTSITVVIQIICIHSTILYAWLSTQKFRSPIDFKEFGSLVSDMDKLAKTLFKKTILNNKLDK